MQKLNAMVWSKEVAAEATENTNRNTKRKVSLKVECNMMAAASKTGGQTLTLCLRRESHCKFGKEFVAFKSLLLGPGPETAFREVLWADLDSGVKRNFEHELIFSKPSRK